MFKLLSKILIACLIGIFITIYIIQNQTDFKLSIKKKIIEITNQQIGCKLNFDIKSINLFFPLIELENIYVSEENNNKWSWNCKKIIFKCSWIDFLLKKKFKAKIKIINFDGNSIIENEKVEIWEHIKKAFLGNSNLPIIIDNIKLTKSLLNLIDKKSNLQMQFTFDGNMKLLNNYFKIIFYMNNGKIFKGDYIFFKEIFGTSLIDKNHNSQININFSGSCDLPFLQLTDNRCHFVGEWNNLKKNLRINTIDGNLNIGPINFINTLKDNIINFKIKSPISYIKKLLNLTYDFDLDGKCILKVKTDLSLKKLKASAKIINIKIQSQPIQIIDNIKIKLNKNENDWSGVFDINKKNTLNILGKWSSRVNQDLIKSIYSCTISDIQINKNINANGAIEINKDLILANGNFSNHNYELICKLNPKLILKKFSFSNNKKKELINIKTDESGKIEASTKFENIIEFLPEVINQNLKGFGQINLNCICEKNNLIGNINTNNLTLSLPKFGNIIKDLKCKINIDLNEKKITINNCKFTMNKGSLSTDNASIIFKDKNFIPNFIYFPLTIENCFIGYKKDIFATLSGKIIFQKLINDKLNLNGFLLFSNSQIKNNIFSKEFREEILGKNDLKNIDNNNINNIRINLALLSDDLIKIKTPFINSKIKLDIKLHNKNSDPNIEGSINIEEGTIIFPYKNLNIVNGGIYFLPNQFNDPMINLTAKNNIKGYNITMFVTGSAQNHNIKFESSPTLTSEQIIALLFVGSHTGMLMPALLMDNIKNIILGSSAMHLKMKKYFDTFLKPLKYVKFVPTFTNDMGKTGIKGAIEIDLSDRLHASISKNFTAPEDTRFEVDYTVTDEINIKAIKDERGDLGGQVEMRWKF